MTVRIIVRVASYAEMTERGGDHLIDFRTVDVESPELEKLLKLDYGNRAHATVIGAELLKPARPCTHPNCTCKVNWDTWEGCEAGAKEPPTGVMASQAQQPIGYVHKDAAAHHLKDPSGWARVQATADDTFTVPVYATYGVAVVRGETDAPEGAAAGVKGLDE